MGGQWVDGGGGGGCTCSPSSVVAVEVLCVCLWCSFSPPLMSFETFFYPPNPGWGAVGGVRVKLHAARTVNVHWPHLARQRQ